jgi:hypothetical protein
MIYRKNFRTATLISTAKSILFGECGPRAWVGSSALAAEILRQQAPLPG